MDADAKRQRERSPNYPTLGLPEAIKRAMDIYSKERRNSMMLLLAAQRIGYSSLSGPARSTLSTLRKYGLLTDAGNGEVKLTEDAVAIAVYKEGSAEREAAIRRCALKPDLIREVLKDHPEPVSDENLKAKLIMQKGFTESAAETFVKALNSTIALAKLNEMPDNDFGDEPGHTDGDGSEMPDNAGIFDGNSKLDNAAIRRFGSQQSVRDGEKELLRYNLSGNRGVRLLFSGPQPTQKNIQELLDQIESGRVTFPSTEPVQEPEPMKTAPSPLESKKPTEVGNHTGSANADDKSAAVSFFITKAQKVKLREKGYDDEQIATMKPDEAHRILGLD